MSSQLSAVSGQQDKEQGDEASWSLWQLTTGN
jgi:hypothetical protein